MSFIKKGFKAVGHAIKDHKTKCDVNLQLIKMKVSSVRDVQLKPRITRGSKGSQVLDAFRVTK